MASSNIEDGRQPPRPQTSSGMSGGMQAIVAALSNAQTLSQLEGMSKELDLQFGMVGPETLSGILGEGLANVLQKNPSLLARAQSLFDTTDTTSPGDNRGMLQPIAILLGDIFRASDELRGEVQYEIWKAGQIGWTRCIQEGKPSVLWDEERLEKLFLSEYDSIETGVFDRLDRKLQRHRIGSRATAEGETGGLVTSTSVPSLRDEGESDGRALIPLGNGVNLDVFAWDEMQKRAQKIDPSALGKQWKRKPRRSILWLLQNCTQEQLLYYVYHHAHELDTELREAFVKVIKADKQGHIPLIWKSIVMRALARSPVGTSD